MTEGSRFRRFSPRESYARSIGEKNIQGETGKGVGERQGTIKSGTSPGKG